MIVRFLVGTNPPPDGFARICLNDPDQRDAQLVMADDYQEAGRARDAELLRDTEHAAVTVAGCVVDPTLTLFSPYYAREEWFRVARENRKSKIPPAQLNRCKAKPKLTPRRTTPHTYAHAVRVAAAKANVPHWHPNQLRHLFATDARKQHGLEAAQVLLGRSRADVRQVDAERNEELAATVAASVG